jgi:hypothetical protein
MKCFRKQVDKDSLLFSYVSCLEFVRKFRLSPVKKNKEMGVMIRAQREIRNLLILVIRKEKKEIGTLSRKLQDYNKLSLSKGSSC